MAEVVSEYEEVFSERLNMVTSFSGQVDWKYQLLSCSLCTFKLLVEQELDRLPENMDYIIWLCLNHPDSTPLNCLTVVQSYAALADSVIHHFSEIQPMT